MAPDAGTTLRLYNTLTRGKDDFRPIDPADVRMYVCGPTVYDFAHIGNARPVIVFDTLFRLLRHVYGPEHVTYVRNITDVDDKINARALRDYPDLPLNEAIRRVTEKTAEQFHRDVAALGCLSPTFEPRATEFVLARPDGKANMAGLIQDLIDRGHAYEANGEILFDISSMPDYGQLSRRNLDEQQAGARVAVDAHKKSPGDFVLWKQSSSEEPGWEATFRVGGRSVTVRGRPGWHIECSAMSAAYLGNVFDIHGGGLDLIFPHHENEIAQSRCAHGTDAMANVWMHNGFVQVEGRKMAKSEGNFVTIHDLLETGNFGGRKWPGEVLRLAMLMTHYREPIDFSVNRLREAVAVLDRWERIVSDTKLEDAAPHEGFVSLLCDDLNVPEAISLVHSLMIGSERDVSQALASLALIGLDPRREVSIDSALEAMIELRLQHIRERNWSEADRIRDELAGRGVLLKDGKDPATGERITTWEMKR